jgi:putative transposase
VRPAAVQAWVPTFKKKGQHDRFRADNGPDRQHPDAIRVCGKCVQLPVIGRVVMREAVRFVGRMRSVTISRQADGLYASFSLQVDDEPSVRADTSVIGVDLGITALTALSDDSPKIPAPKPLRRYLQKLKRLSRSLSRKQRQSHIVPKQTKLARLHRRIADIRAEALHKLTTSLMRYRTIVIDLNVAGMWPIAISLSPSPDRR